MKKYFLLTLPVILILAVVACNKTPTPSTPGRADMFRVGKWKISGGTFTKRLPDGHDTVLTYLNFIPDCHKDDYIIFDSGLNAAVYSGSNKCNPSDADHIPFVWQLKNNGNNIDLYSGFNNLYSCWETIMPYYFDTLQNNSSDTPPLILDTLIGALDTPKRGHNIVLDSMWNVHLDTMATPQISIYNAIITNFSQSAFTIKFSVISTYPDSTNNHATIPITRPDTMKYIVTYSNF